MKIKKKKLIVLIIFIILIITIFFIINIIRNSTNIKDENYFSTIENVNSELVANYIKAGVKIGGITGKLQSIDTSDADALAEDLVFGKKGYVNGNKIIGTYVPSYNYTYTDSLGNEVKVPGGFKIVNLEDNVVDGIVIEDVNAGGVYTKGSQFVWIPIGDIIIDEKGNSTNIELGRYTFEINGSETLIQSAKNWNQEIGIGIYKEATTSSYKNALAKDLEDFVTKATDSGGYYIGRYEAGDGKATDTSRTKDTSIENPVVCKSGVYPYTYVTQPQASTLCQRMYTSKNFESDLINSYAIDTAIVFIQTFSKDKDYARQSGNNTNNALQKCGESILKKVAEGDEKQDVRCNIYDMAGNTYEWTTEMTTNRSNPCMIRGGSCQSGYTSQRQTDYFGVTGAFDTYSFRNILYL